MSARPLTPLVLAALACGFGPAQARGQRPPDPRDRAAWTDARIAPEVMVDGRWYALRSADGVPVGRIVEFAMKTDNDHWARRVSEDFVEFFNQMGHPAGGTVALVVQDLETGKERTLEKVPLTKANRDALKERRWASEGRPKKVRGQKPLDSFDRAAWTAARFVPEVNVDGRWYALRSVDAVRVEKIVEHAVKKDSDHWARRVSDDLVELLTQMGHPPGDAVALVVRDLESGKERTLDKVPLTKANRDALLKRRAEFEARGLPPLKPEALHGALDAFQAALNDRWSYRQANRADIAAAVAALRKRVDAGVATDEFGIELEKIVALGVDGHAGVSGYRLPRGGGLPFLVEAEGERVVAFNAKRTAFLAEGFPYLTRLDGRDVADWCAAAAALVPKGSPQYVRRRSLRYLRELDYVRGLMGLPKKDTVEVELADRAGRARKTLTLPVSYVTGPDRWPTGGSRVLDGNVGYLRLPSMNANAVAEIKTWMPKFRDTAGLVIDVRDNGGGIRDPLILLYSYLAAPEDPPRVFTAAAYRLHPAHKETHLAERFMYRADDREWSDDERRAVAAFAKAFKPEWELPKGQFSDWHYMVLSRRNDPGVYHYSKPVAVLMNARCFSATDIFLAGLKGMKNVTLVGTASGGGSALTQEVPLGASPFVLRIGSMASFQADGKLFDGNGVRPDVEVAPVPEYHIGGRDNVLEEAVKRVKDG